jgi:hypothetical protein
LNPNQITRLTNGTDGSLIDHVFSNLHENSTFNIIENNISDHLAVMVELNIKLLQKRDIHKFTRSYKEENWSKFIALLLQEEWHYLYSQQDVDKKSELFMNTLINYFERSFALNKITIKANQVNKIRLSDTTSSLKESLIRLSDDIKYEQCQVALSKLRSKKKLLKKQVGNAIRSEIKTQNSSKLEKKF